MSKKKIILIGTIPVMFIIMVMLWNIILEGFSESSDIVVILSAVATGFIIVALLFLIKFIIKKIK